MMQTGCQQQHSTDVQQQQHPSSPRGGGGMPNKLSLLGQQLHHYGASPPAAHQPCHGFSIVGALEPQQHLQAHFHHQSHMAAAPNAFQNLLQQGFLLTASQQGYNLQLAAPQIPQGLVEDLIKLSPPGSPPMEGRVVAPAYSLVAMLEQKTEQLQALVHSLSQGSQHNGGVVQPQAAMAAARMASNISQLALATVGVPPPNAPQSPFVPPEMQPNHHFLGGLGLFQQGNMGSCSSLAAAPAVRNPLPAVEQQEPREPQQQQQQEDSEHAFGVENIQQQLPRNVVETEGEASNPPPQVVAMEDGDSGAGSRDEDDDGEPEDLTPGSYDLVEMNAVEILAEHTHFCDKCGKGFKRDANLRMHMRGHGEQYKSPAALARPDKFSQDPAVRPRRYSCPYVGCKRNKKHRKFQPLKTVLCVKNHYRRSHCPKSLTCSKCKSKKFSVMADLKTHEKHCGRDKWQCSCGTTFSRKDKLLGHISLFQGHTPALPLHEMEGSASAPAEHGTSIDAPGAASSDAVGIGSGSC